jgi:hypothetical protein
MGTAERLIQMDSDSVIAVTVSVSVCVEWLMPRVGMPIHMEICRRWYVQVLVPVPRVSVEITVSGVTMNVAVSDVGMCVAMDSIGMTVTMAHVSVCVSMAGVGMNVYRRNRWGVNVEIDLR